MGLWGGGGEIEPYSRHTRSVLQATRRESLEVVPFQQPADKHKGRRDGLRIIPIKPPGPANYSPFPSGDVGAGGWRHGLWTGNLGADVYRPATGSETAAFQQRTWRWAPTGSKDWSAAQSGSAKGQRGDSRQPEEGSCSPLGASAGPSAANRPAARACVYGWRGSSNTSSAGPCSASGMRRVRYAPEGSILLTRCAENAIIGVERTPGGCTLEGASAESPLSIQSGQRDPLERGPFPVN